MLLTEKDLAIYIHWPFCLSKCPYCAFNSYVRCDIDQAEWLECYLKELKRYKFILGERNITSIYFGGGTPSLMDVRVVEAILKEIDDLWGFNKDIEITLEANPTTAEYNKFEAFSKIGINRLSIGVQSFNDNSLEYLGRKHSAEEAVKCLDMASKIFDRYSFDLIYALEYQTIKEWREELNIALNYSGGHMSLYQLSIEDSTKFHSLYQKGKISELEDDVSAEMFEVTQEIMDKWHHPAYEVSNHAKEGHESKHNLTYWNYKDYIGIGAGAHGRMTVDGKKVAISNVKNPEQWQKRVEDPVIEHLKPKEALTEELLMGLRLYSGIKWQDEFLNVISEVNMDELICKGLMVQDKDIIRVTKEGMQRLNAVLSYIL